MKTIVKIFGYTIVMSLALIAIFGVISIMDRYPFSNRVTPPHVPSKESPPVAEIADDPIRTHFVTGSPTARSNALYFHGVPAGWSIVCDGKGHYAPKFDTLIMGFVDTGVGNDDATIRTNEHEAIIAAWRLKEVFEGMEKQDAIKAAASQSYNWQDCNQ